MDNPTLEKTQVDMPADIAKRFNEAKTDADRHAVLRDYAVTLGSDQKTLQKEATILSEDQMRQILEKVGEASATQAKAAIAAVAADTERRLNLNPDEAREIAERSFDKAAAAHRNRRADLEICAEVFRGIHLARAGKATAFQEAIAKEDAYLRKTYGIQSRALSLGTDSSGGYLAPTLFSNWLYENISRTSLVRKYAKMIPMNRNEIINIPTMTAGISAAVVSEATGSTGVQPTFSQKQLTTKKIMSKSKPISIEMVEKANPAIVELILQHAILEVRKAEDSLVFGTSGNGIRASSTNLVTLGSAASGYSSVEFDDLISMESELTAEYLGGDDIQGSDIIADIPRYWLPHALVQTLKAKKEVGTGAYLDEARELRNQKQIFGYDAKRVLSLPDGISPALAAATKVAIFGNLQHVWCGYEADFRVDVFDQGSVDDGGSLVSLADTGQVAVRVIEFFDNVVVDAEAFSIASLAA